jgi:hypothetical protein
LSFSRAGARRALNATENRGDLEWVKSVALTIHYLMRQYAMRYDRFHDLLDQLVAQIAQRQTRRMMCRDHQVGDGYRRIVFVLYRHLGFAVRIEALQDPLLTHRRQSPSELMRDPASVIFLDVSVCWTNTALGKSLLG